MSLVDFEQKTLFEANLDNTSHGLKIIYRGEKLSGAIETLLGSDELSRYSPLPAEVKCLKSSQEIPQQTTVFLDRGHKYLLETNDIQTTDENGITTTIQTLNITRIKKEETLEEMLTKREKNRERFNKQRSSIHIVDLERTGEFIDGYGPKNTPI